MYIYHSISVWLYMDPENKMFPNIVLELWPAETLLGMSYT